MLPRGRGRTASPRTLRAWFGAMQWQAGVLGRCWVLSLLLYTQGGSAAWNLSNISGTESGRNFLTNGGPLGYIFACANLLLIVQIRADLPVIQHCASTAIAASTLRAHRWQLAQSTALPARVRKGSGAKDVTSVSTASIMTRAAEVGSGLCCCCAS